MWRIVWLAGTMWIPIESSLPIPSAILRTYRRLKELLLQHEPPFAEILETDAGSTVTSHCGPNTLGILFMKK